MTNYQTQARERELAAIERMLARGFVTAAQIAARMKCSRPSVHRRLQALFADLKKRRVRVEQKMVRQGARGPESVAYAIAKGTRR